MNNEAVLKKIEQICDNKGWSKYRLSKESGIALSTISSLFRTRSNISLTRLYEICGAFHLKLSEFFSLVEDKEPARDLRYEAESMAERISGLSENNRRLLDSIVKVMAELEREQRTRREEHRSESEEIINGSEFGCERDSVSTAGHQGESRDEGHDEGDSYYIGG